MVKVKEIFGDLPQRETERLILRKMVLEDAQDLFEYASDPEVTEFVVWKTHTSIEDSLGYLRFKIEQYERKSVSEWGIVLKENKKFIGTCGFIMWDTSSSRAEIGYALSRKYWNRGLMTEAIREVLDFGFRKMGLNRIEARCMLGNDASEKVMKKVGMKYEGILREQMFVKGTFKDLKIYSILRSDYMR
jgi:ribosomal-protein-alanine N-acetyltransferase